MFTSLGVVSIPAEAFLLQSGLQIAHFYGIIIRKVPMKFQITVELMQGDKPVTPKDLKQYGFGSINFVKAAPKAFKRAMKATCWPFNAKVEVELVEK